jgi:deazaflavin-dependent oxidoreductase (nitroreductase family)
MRRQLNAYERLLERFARTPPGYWYVTRLAPRIDPPLLRLSGGRISSVFPVPVMLLTTIGAKTGRRRTLPLLYVVDGDSLILIASNYGRPGNPSWYRNLQANPRVEVLAGRRSGIYTASEIADSAERDDAWGKALDVYAGYADYEVRAGNRIIPLIRLRRT